MTTPYSRYSVYIKPVIKNRYVKAYSSVVFSLIAITFFSLFAIKPTFKTIIALQKNIEEQKQVLEKLTDKSKNLEIAIKNYKALDPQIKSKIETLVPNKPEAVSFAKDLTTIAKINQATVSGINFQPFEIINGAKLPTQESDLKELAFTFNLSGSYPSMLKTLDSLSNSSHLILLDTVSISKGEKGLIMNVVGRTIY